MAGPTDVVIAGTKPFALALFAPVTERAGTRPRIAPEPSAALTLCAESSGVLVVEYEPRWLPAIARLRQERPGLRVVAALAPGQEGALQSLGPLLVDAVPWDGRAISVLPAIERALGGSRGAAASPAIAGIPPPAPPAAPAPVQPGGNGSPTLDLFGDPGAAAATPFPASLAPVPGESPAPAPLDLFTDLGATEATPSPASLAGAAVRSAGAPGSVAWPASGPSAVEAEAMLREALAGAGELSPHRAVVQQAIAGLSELEREVFTDGAPGLDAEPIRHAAVLRLRVALALATRPPPGASVDGAAVAELLSEIDALLGAVKGLLAAAPPQVQASLEAIRNALVKEAVDFSEACHEVGTAEVPLAPALARDAGRAASARVLSVHAGVSAEDRPGEQRRRMVPGVVLLVVLAIGVAYHAWNYYSAPPKQPPATFEGAPMGTMAVQSGKANFLVALPGQKVNAADLEAYRQREARRGNQVRQVGPSTWIIEPAPAGSGGAP